MSFEEDFEVIDTITADTIEIGDQILYQGDYVEVHTILDEGILIQISGYSYIEDDNIKYTLNPGEEIDLWWLP